VKTWKRIEWGDECPKAGKAKRRLIREHFPELDREWQRLDAVACMSNTPAHLPGKEEHEQGA
jgi:hypothetical protein